MNIGDFDKLKRLEGRFSRKDHGNLAELAQSFEAVFDHVDALLDQIDRLTSENEALEYRISELEAEIEAAS